MNITDLIVELLEKGQKVEMPGIGTLDTVMRNAHHDPATRTYYPASRTVAFSTDTTGDSEIVKVLAERECVNEDVAKQMWLNYIDALTDKVKRSGQHKFGRLGLLTCADKRTFGFKVAEGLVLDADNKGEMPIEEVKIYNHDGEEDPFARFDEAEAAAEPAAAAEPEPVEEPVAAKPEPVEEPVATEPEPVEEPVTAEPEPVEEPAAPEAEPAEEPVAQEEHWDESLKKLEDLEKEQPAPDPKALARAEKERLKAEKKAEEERIRLEKKAAEQKRYEEEMLAKQRKEAERREAEEKRKAEEELRKAEKKAEEERIKAEKKAEAGRIKAEKEAEKERIKAEKKAAALAAIAARENAKAEAAARSAAEKEAARQAAAQAAEADKLRREAEKEAARQAAEAERQRKDAEKEAAKQASEAEKAAAKAEKERRKEEAAKVEKLRKEAEKERKEAEKAAAKQAKKNKELADKLTAPAKEKKEDGDKKKRLGALPLILILLCLLLVGGGAYYLLTRNNAPSASATARTTTHIDTGISNSLTYNTDMITCNEREIAQQSDMVCRYMSEYISQYLADRTFSGARAPMMDRIRQYAGERLGQMLGDRYAVQRLIPYTDYIYNYNEPFMKKSYARSCRGQVQSELMSYRALDDMLYRMVDELGLQPDGTGRKTAAELQQVKADEKKAIERRKQKAQNGEAPVYVYVEKGSKQGYDLIAGFYLNKSTAAKLTARLHDMGCDAYIIEFNDMYYVSMGSASTQTSADALYKHVKSWYDGDVVIKKW